MKSFKDFKKLAKIHKEMNRNEDKLRWARTGSHRVHLPLRKHPVPTVGEVRHFFDDGKIRESRHYMATVTEVIPFKRVPQKLKKAWRKERWDCYWLYAYETDYFIKCKIPKYDEKPIYFARTQDGGWFSFDYGTWWMSGRMMESDFDWERERREYE
jgi:hypothetical protein